MNAAAESTTIDQAQQVVVEHLSLMPVQAEINLLPETKALIKTASEFGDLVISIKTQQDRMTASEQRAKIKGLAKEIENKRVDLKKPFDKAAKEVQDYFKPLLDALDRADRAIAQAAIQYDQEQEKLRQIEEAKAAEATRKEAEKLAAKAEKLEEKGKVEQAEAVREQAATVVAVPLQTNVPVKMAGESARSTYSAEVKSPIDLIKAVAATALLSDCEGDAKRLLAQVKALASYNVPQIAVTPDTKFLNQQAKALKDHLKYPGVTVVKKSVLAARSASPYA